MVWSGQVEQLRTDCISWGIGSGPSASARGVSLAWVVPIAGRAAVGQGEQVGGVILREAMGWVGRTASDGLDLLGDWKRTIGIGQESIIGMGTTICRPYSG